MPAPGPEEDVQGVDSLHHPHLQAERRNSSQTLGCGLGWPSICLHTLGFVQGWNGDFGEGVVLQKASPVSIQGGGAPSAWHCPDTTSHTPPTQTNWQTEHWEPPYLYSIPPPGGEKETHTASRIQTQSILYGHRHRETARPGGQSETFINIWK